jgi:hypothetical protein
VTPPVIYLAHPVAPTEQQIDAKMCLLPGETFGLPREVAVAYCVRDNLDSATHWLRWFVEHTDWAICAPWIPYVQALNDATSSHRERGLRDDCLMAERCDGIVLVGGRLSSGMEREMVAVRQKGGFVIDLLSLGPSPRVAPPCPPDHTWAGHLTWRLEHARAQL